MIRSCLLTLSKAALAILLVVTAAICQSSVPTEPPPVNVSGVSILISRDKLLIRELQLAITQQHVARLQAEAKIKAYEDQLNQTIEDLKVQYSCPGCTLNPDFTWTKPEPKAPANPTTPAPKSDGQTSPKE